jgi:hypothetical protein
MKSLGAEIKHLNALVEEAVKKNHALISIGSKLSLCCPLSFALHEWNVLSCFVSVAEAHEKALPDARVGYVKESLLREVEERATAAEAAAKRSESEVMDLTQVLNDKNKELEDIIVEHKGKLAAELN